MAGKAMGKVSVFRYLFLLFFKLCCLFFPENPAEQWERNERQRETGSC